jgi:hypothetical protein
VDTTPASPAVIHSTREPFAALPGGANVFLVRINDGTFRLPAGEGIARLRADIVSAVRDGGGFVTIAHLTGSSDVLIGPASSVQIDEVPNAVTPVATASPTRSWSVAERVPGFVDFEPFGDF